MSDFRHLAVRLARVLWPIVVPAISFGQAPVPPIARQAPTSIRVHGKTLVDPYSWLERAQDPEAIAYLEAENRYASAVIGNTQGLQEELYREMRSRVDEADPQPPLRIGNDWYYLRSAPDSQFLLLCRRRGGLKASEEVLVDLNQMAGGRKKPNLGVWRLSPNRRYLAYSVDTDGSEAFTIYVRALQGNGIQEERISGAGRWFEWAADSQTLFYTTPAYGNPPLKLKRHRVGAPEVADDVLHSDSARLGLTRTASGEFLLLFIYGNAGISEVRFLPANRPLGSFQIIEPRRPDVQYQVAQQGRFFYILVNETAGSHILRAPIGTQDRSAWEEVVPAQPGRDVWAFDVVGDEIILAIRLDGLARMKAYHVRARTERDIPFPEPLGSPGVVSNLEREFPTWRNPGANAVRLVFESFVSPRSLSEYDWKRRALRLLWQAHVPGYQPELYESRRVFATASDGTRIPISLVYKKPLVQDGQRPLLLYVYGSGGFSVTPSFEAERVSLLDRGIVYAVAHVRGGGELGKAWHEAAMGRNKVITLSDFIASAEYLLAERYTSHGRLAITGHSAGGIPVTAAANMRPELFQAVIAKAPVTELFYPSGTPGRLRGGPGELGDSNEKADFDAMYAYSPYDNIRAQAYPHMLITASRTDPRTGYAPAAKFVAKLRAANTGSHMLLLKTDFEGGGHMGAAGRLDHWRETAFEYAFIIEALKITR